MRDHMNTHHRGYSDDGRVISEEDYARLVHDLDHDGRTEGIIIPHTHGEGGTVLHLDGGKCHDPENCDGGEVEAMGGKR